MCSILLSSLCRTIRRQASFCTYTELGKMEHSSLKYEQLLWAGLLTKAMIIYGGISGHGMAEWERYFWTGRTCSSYCGQQPITSVHETGSAHLHRTEVGISNAFRLVSRVTGHKNFNHQQSNIKLAHVFQWFPGSPSSHLSSFYYLYQ